MIHNRKYPKSFSYICHVCIFFWWIGKKVKELLLDVIRLKFVVSCSGEVVNKTDRRLLSSLALQSGLGERSKQAFEDYKNGGAWEELETAGLKNIVSYFFLTAGQVKRVCGKFAGWWEHVTQDRLSRQNATCPCSSACHTSKTQRSHCVVRRIKENLEMLGLLCLEK